MDQGPLLCPVPALVICPHVTFPSCQCKSVPAAPRRESDEAESLLGEKICVVYISPCIFAHPMTCDDVISGWQVGGRFFVLWVVLVEAHAKSESDGHRDAARMDLVEPSTPTPCHHEQNLPF